MELDVTGIGRNAPVQDIARRTMDESAKRARQAAQKMAETAAEKQSSQDVEKVLDEILNLTQFFNKRLRFTVNRELGEVVVKVIDSQTDKVIKEIPPEVLQKLHVRIREAIGLLIDEMI